MKCRGTQWGFVLCLLLAVASDAQDNIDSSNHSVRMISVEKDVSLEVLDWGGVGRPLILLAGLGDNAHIFDKFAPQLTANYHVYGITRRGRGVSSKPEPNQVKYTADRLGEDVMAVIGALNLNKPILAGHSFPGEEMSYIGAHHPELVAGLIYIEAGYPYALYDEASGELELDAIELRRQLGQFTNGYAQEPIKNYDDLIANLERVEKEIQKHQQDTKGLPPTPVSPRMTPDLFAMMDGRERFTAIHAPALVIFGADPSPILGINPETRAQSVRQELEMRIKNSQIAAWKRQVPSAHIVLIPHATHYVFQSNEDDVLRAMNDFIATLPH